MIDDPTCGFFIACVNERVVGQLHIGRHPKFGFIAFGMMVEAAIDFYQRYGFQHHSYHVGYCTRRNGEVWDAVRMTKRIS